MGCWQRKMDNTFKENVPTGWTSRTLGEVAFWGSGGTPSRRVAHYFEGNIPWIKTGELGPKFIQDSDEYISEEAINKSSAKVFPTGSVGIAMYGATIGKVSIWGIDASTNQACAVAQPFDKVLFNEYLYYFLLSEKRGLIEAGKGGAQPNISQGILKEWPILLPPLLEQHRIVAKIEALFSELDKGIESFRTAREQLKIYRQALLKHAFSGKLTEQWRAENQDKLESAEALLQRIQSERQQRYQQQLKEWEANGKQGSKPKVPKTLPPLTDEELAELPELPEGWVYSRLGVLIDEPTYGTAKKCDYDKKGIGVLRIPNVVSRRIDSSDMKFAQFNDDEIAAYKLDADDILLIRSNGSISIVGRCALVSEHDIGYLYAGYLIKLSPNQKLIVPSYLINQISAHSLRRQIEKKAKSTSGVNNINSGEIQSLFVALCSIEEQIKLLAELDSKLSIIDQLEQTINSSLQQAEALRQSILKKAFSGQLVPQDPNDEPASVLLERIHAEKVNAKPAKTKRTTNKKATA
jgi:type I restriction enzyme S subunit